MTTRRTRALALGASLAVPLTAIAACGSDDESPDAGPAPLSVGIIGVAADAGLWAAEDLGFFEDEGLEVTLHQAGAGASAIAPAVQSGDLDVGSGGLDVVITGTSRGFDFVALGHDGAPLSHATNLPGDEHGDFGVLSMDESLTEPGDLGGTTIAVSTLLSINTIMVSAWLEEAGVDPDTVEFVEVPFPSMEQAMTDGQVDAAFTIEPLLSQALDGGAHVIGYPIADTYPGRAHAGYFATRAYVDAHPDELAAFTRATVRGNEYVMDDPDYYRELLAEHTDIPAETLAAMRLPALSTPSEQDIMEILADLTYRYGVIPEPFEGDPSELLHFAEG
jgi:NitT/TauT family transport system substrate-binding protein